MAAASPPILLLTMGVVKVEGAAIINWTCGWMLVATDMTAVGMV